MRVVVADDEPLALRGLVRLLAGVSDVEIVGTASTGTDALALIRATGPDLVFLDVQMPGLTGLDVAATVTINGPPDIIFVTAFDHYAAGAFDVDAVDYLLKPLRPDRLHQGLQRARRRLAEQPPERESPANLCRPEVRITDRYGRIDVPQSEVVWIEAAKDYSLIHTERRSFILRTTMKDLAARLCLPIIRVHRSAFVSLNRVETTHTNEKGAITLLLHEGTSISVGPSYARMVRDALRRARA